MAKVLLAADDELLPVLALYLCNDDHEVICAANADEAVNAACARRPDAMIIDISLSDDSGTSVFRRVAEERALASIPVIFLVGENAQRGGRAPKLPVESAVHKPVPAGELLAKLHQALGAAESRKGFARGAAGDSSARAGDPRPRSGLAARTA